MTISVFGLDSVLSTPVEKYLSVSIDLLFYKGTSVRY